MTNVEETLTSSFRGIKIDDVVCNFVGIESRELYNTYFKTLYGYLFLVFKESSSTKMMTLSIREFRMNNFIQEV